MIINSFNTKTLLQELKDKNITEYDLFLYYCNNFKKINSSFISEFGNIRGEKSPSSRIKYIGGKLLFKDFGESDLAVDIFGYVKRKYNISIEESINKIAKDFGIKGVCSSISNKINNPKSVILSKKENSIIRYRSRDFSMKDLEYWKQYNITLDILELFKVKSIEYFWVDNYCFKVTDLGYVYLIGNRRKIYQPASKNKWFSNCTKEDVPQGFEQLNHNVKYDLIIITKSLKDVMSLYSCGYNAIAVNSESTWMNDYYLSKVKLLTNNIILFYDNDKAGIKESEKISKLYNLPNIRIPEYCKDFSDLIKKYGVNIAKIWIKNCLARELGKGDIDGNYGLLTS